MSFNEVAATAIAVRLLQAAPENKLNDIHFMKLIYLVERAYLERSSVMLTDSRLVSMEHGPVLSDVYALMSGQTTGDTWHENISTVPFCADSKESNHIRLLSHAALDPTDHLSRNAIALVDHIWARYGFRSKWSVRDLTHRFGEWNPEAEEKETSIPLTLHDVFSKGFQLPEEEALRRAQEAEYFRRFESA
jgi:uncharacterized phage-associated protein